MENKIFPITQTNTATITFNIKKKKPGNNFFFSLGNIKYDITHLFTKMQNIFNSVKRLKEIRRGESKIDPLNFRSIYRDTAQNFVHKIASYL